MDTTTEGGHLLYIYMAHYRYYNDTPLDGEVLLVSDALTSHHKSLSRRPPCKLVVCTTPAVYGKILTRSLRVSESAFPSPTTDSSTVETNSGISNITQVPVTHACFGRHLRDSAFERIARSKHYCAKNKIAMAHGNRQHDV